MKTALKYISGVIAVGALGGLVAAAVYLFWLTNDLPSYEALKHYKPPVTTRLYAGDGTLIAEYARERRLFVPIGSMPPLVKAAFLSAEDKNFYSHPGIDIFGIVRAAVNNVPNVLTGHEMHGGASTITQQVARNFLLSKEVTVSRKLREMVLAMRIDNALSKDQVFELYLNQMFFGANSYGVTAAAVNYFGKSLDQLTVAQTAYLAGLMKGPSNYEPVRHKSAAIARRNWVIDQMAENGYLTREQAATAKAEDLITTNRPIGAVVPDVDYFVEEVRRLLNDKYGNKALYDGGLQVRSTLDPRLQEIAVRSLRAGLVAYDHRHGWRGPATNIELTDGWTAKFAKLPNKSGVSSWKLAVVTGENAKAKEVNITFQDGTDGRLSKVADPKATGTDTNWVRALPGLKSGDVVYVEALIGEGRGPREYGLRQIPLANGAIVAIDPFTGHVLALSGGFSYASSQFDRAMQAQRQPGSTFKPFVYATALDNGYTPVSKVLDEPFCVSPGPFQPNWCPENYESGEYLGETTLRRGVEQSENVMTARLANTIGMKPVAATVERMGVYDKLPPLIANSLGSQVTTLLRMTTGYAEFVNGGRKLQATLIDRVQDRDGATVYRFDQRECADCNAADWHDQEEPLLPENQAQVLDPRTAFQIVSILEGVVQRGTARVSVGGAVKFPVAGKTGTSSDFHDAWFIGFSPDLAVGVFIGKDNYDTLGHGEQGALAAAPVFSSFMNAALGSKPPTPFRVPQGIVLVPIDPVSGSMVRAGTPGALMEAFKPGTEPGAQAVAADDEFGAGSGGGEGTDLATPASAGASNAATPSSDSVNVQIGGGTGGLY